MIQYALIAGLTLVVTFVLAFAVYRLALRFKLYPAIRERDVHTRPTPRLGGVAMFLALAIAFLYASQNPVLAQTFVDATPVWSILGASALIVTVGVLDDLFDLDWMIKLAAQFIAAGIIAVGGVQIYSLPIGGLTVGSSAMSFTLTVFVIVLVMNAVNFIDGLDGLVAGVALIANGVFLIYGSLLVTALGQSSYFNLSLLLSAIIIGMCAGFLPLNWRPARMFMGDAGALLIGLLMATSAIAITGQIDPSTLGTGSSTPVFGRSQLIGAFIPIILPIAILIVPLADFALAVIRRLAAGKSPFAADRKHLHHRLLDMGHGHLISVLVFYAWTTVISVSCLLFFIFKPLWIGWTFTIVGIIACALFTIWPVLCRRVPWFRDRFAPKPKPGTAAEGEAVAVVADTSVADVASAAAIADTSATDSVAAPTAAASSDTPSRTVTPENSPASDSPRKG